VVAGALQLGHNRKFLSGIEHEYADAPIHMPDHLHCFIDRRCMPGYIGWVLQGAGVTQVGLARRQSARDEMHVAAAMERFLDKIAPLFDFRGRQPTAVRAGLIPCGGIVHPVARSRVLLVGDFGDGAINAFDPTTGASLGHLNDAKGAPILIQGLWDLKFGNGTQAGDPTKLYFTAGIAAGGAIEDHGLFGAISYNAAFMFTQVTRNGNSLTLNWSGGVPPYVIQMKSDIGSQTWTDVKTVNETTADIPMDAAAGYFRVSSTANP
jgi:hypothetical protein